MADPRAVPDRTARALRVVEEDRLTDFDRRWMPATLRYAANAVMRDNPREYKQARRLRLLADELAGESGDGSTCRCGGFGVGWLAQPCGPACAKNNATSDEESAK